MNETEIKFEEIAIEEKTVLLEILGYRIGEGGIILDNETRKEHICPITGSVVFIENASILPGSTVVINTSELSLAEYFTKFVENVK